MKYALHFAVLSLAAAFACATPSPTEYRDGAPMRPAETRPVYTPAGAGLPEYWAEPQPEAKPRSPHKRYLPPSREPGIWAGDSPMASSDANADPRLFRVPLPTPEADPDPQDKAIAIYCAVSMETAAVSSGVPASMFKIDMDARQCLAAKLYRACVETMLSRAEAWKTSGKAYNAAMLLRYKAIAKTAQAFMVGACSEEHNANPTIEEWATTIYTTWLRGTLRDPK